MFDFLAWYRPLVITEPLIVEPALADLVQPRMWVLRNPGTLTARHYANMSLKSLGRVSIDAGELGGIFPQRMSALSSVVSDISLANNITVHSLGPHEAHRIKHGYPPTPRINVLGDIASLE
jgi:hypothetical protein